MGDVKLNWEVGRFPQAYTMARCAAFFPEAASELSSAFFSQVQSFLECNPPAQGIHWNSGQEIALRLMSWLFGLNTFCHGGTIPAEHQKELDRGVK
ncbi:MAG: hypothetical protein M1541_05795, partial [Acidobacteria bacterium]|nr:hypothetical protein [Acidobacteriota bacterium]